MLICGLKLTHDGAVALLDDDELVFSVEMEKLDNNPRFSAITDLAVVASTLRDFGRDIDEVDHFVVDGWGGTSGPSLDVASDGVPVSVQVAPYRDRGDQHVFAPAWAGTMPVAGRPRPYSSYFHVSGHLAAAYWTSPFAARGEASYVLVWDGGLFPRLYLVGPDGRVDGLGDLFPVMGHVYATAGNYFGPWPRAAGPEVLAGQDVAGQLMAYIALGTERPEVDRTLAGLWDDCFVGPSDRAVRYRGAVGGWGIRADAVHLGAFFGELRDVLGGRFSDEDVLASVHAFLERQLVDATRAAIERRSGSPTRNLCLTGGCALNIKWNSRIRAAGFADEVWVPPFPNDSGAAIGTAISHLVGTAGPGGAHVLDWHARLGPALVDDGPVELPGWDSEPCDVAGLADVLHRENRPVVLLRGRAELGPRALGARSIVAAPVDPAMKEQLNGLKRRAPYRPVAPLCLEDAAPGIFAPGTPDPYMLFDHRVRPDWLSRIPAVVHLDGTARLQTVNDTDDEFLARLLRLYARRSGIPVLCNTSANHNGRGFFPDVRSAAEWDGAELIWNADRLYRRRPV